MAMILETERLLLRPFNPDDFKAVHSWAGNPENTRYMAWGPNTEEQTREFITLFVTVGKDFVVVLKSTGYVIGSCGVYPDSDNDTGVLVGYSIRTIGSAAMGQNSAASLSVTDLKP